MDEVGGGGCNIIFPKCPLSDFVVPFTMWLCRIYTIL